MLNVAIFPLFLICCTKREEKKKGTEQIIPVTRLAYVIFSLHLFRYYNVNSPHLSFSALAFHFLYMYACAIIKD